LGRRGRLLEEGHSGRHDTEGGDGRHCQAGGSPASCEDRLVLSGAEVLVNTRKALLGFALFWCGALIVASCTDQEVLNPLPGSTGEGTVAFDLGQALVNMPSPVQ